MIMECSAWAAMQRSHLVLVRVTARALSGALGRAVSVIPSEASQSTVVQRTGLASDGRSFSGHVSRPMPVLNRVASSTRRSGAVRKASHLPVVERTVLTRRRLR